MSNVCLICRKIFNLFSAAKGRTVCVCVSVHLRHLQRNMLLGLVGPTMRHSHHLRLLLLMWNLLHLWLKRKLRRGDDNMLRRRLHLDRLLVKLLLLLLQLLLLRIGFRLLFDGCGVRHFLTSFDDFRHIEDLRRTSDRLKTITTRSYSPKDGNRKLRHINKSFILFDLRSHALRTSNRAELRALQFLEM